MELQITHSTFSTWNVEK